MRKLLIYIVKLFLKVDITETLKENKQLKYDLKKYHQGRNKAIKNFEERASILTKVKRSIREGEEVEGEMHDLIHANNLIVRRINEINEMRKSEPMEREFYDFRNLGSGGLYQSSK